MIFVTTKTQRITENIFAVNAGMVNMFIVKYGNNTICIDTGMGGGSIRRGLKSLGVDPGEISHIFLTHSDYDHAGGIDLFSKADIFLSGQEEQMIKGEKCRAFGISHNRPIRRKYSLLRDGETVNIGDISVQGIDTPGHTPGSMSYLVNGRYLFVGDTIALMAKRAHPFPGFINMDTGTQLKSIRRLAELEGIDMLLTAHSGYTGDFAYAMKKWRD